MIAQIIAAAVGDQLPPDQLDYLTSLVSDAYGRLGPFAAMSIMGELMGVQALLAAGDTLAATEAAVACAERHGLQELAAFLADLAAGQ